MPTTPAELKKLFREGSIEKPEYIVRMQELHRLMFSYADLIGGTDIAKIEITDEGVFMTSREAGIRILTNTVDKRTAPVEILNFDCYEKTESDMLLQLIGDDDVVFDVGANIGWYALLIEKKRAKAVVHSFEPIPGTYRQLERNLALNGSTRVIPHPFGLSNRNETITFYYVPEGGTNASAANVADVAGAQELSCPIRRLDDFVAENGCRRLDFLKVDVEGAELFVFEGGRDALPRLRPVIFAEMLRKWSAQFGYHPNAIIELLAAWGYRCFTVKGDRLAEFHSMDDQTVETNFFFLHADKHDQLIRSLVV